MLDCLPRLVPQLATEWVVVESAGLIMIVVALLHNLDKPSAP